MRRFKCEDEGAYYAYVTETRDTQKGRKARPSLRLVVGTTGLVLSKGQLAERELARTRRSVECDVSQVLPQARRSCAAEGCTSHEKTRRTRRVLVGTTGLEPVTSCM